MTIFAERLLSTVLAVFVISPVYAQSSNPLVRPSEGMVGRQSPGFLTLQGPGSQIGASARALTTAEMQQRSGDWFKSQAGVVIDEVSSWSPASRAGLIKGDVVTMFDGYRVRDVTHFDKLVEETPPGRTVRMTIVRGEARQQLTITPTL